jgi:hypothetical protein
MAISQETNDFLKAYYNSKRIQFTLYKPTVLVLSLILKYNLLESKHVKQCFIEEHSSISFRSFRQDAVLSSEIMQL